MTRYLVNSSRYKHGFDPHWENVIFYLAMLPPGSEPADISPAAQTITKVTPSEMGYVANAGPVPGMSAWLFGNFAGGNSNTHQLIVNMSQLLDGDFTFECWAANLDFTPNAKILFCITTQTDNIGVPGSHGAGLSSEGSIYYRGEGVIARMGGVPSGTQVIATNLAMHGEQPVGGSWNHYCVERSGSINRFYFNGQPWALTVNNATVLSSLRLFLGGGTTLANQPHARWKGYLGPTRLTRGVARFNGTPFVPGFDTSGLMVETAPSFSTRSWVRVRFTAMNSGGYAKLGEIELRTSPGGPDVASTATHACTATSSQGTAANAIDWPNSMVSATTGLLVGDNITLDLKASYNVQHMILQQGSNYATAFRLQYSDNNTDWTTAASYSTMSPWFSGQRQPFHVPSVGSHRYWRVVIDAVAPSTTADIINVDLSETPTSHSLVVHPHRFGTIHNYNWDKPTGNVFDGNLSTEGWIMNTCGWATVRLANPVSSIEELMIRSTSDNTYTPSAGVVEYSSDGKRWQTDWGWSGLTWGPSESKVITRP